MSIKLKGQPSRAKGAKWSEEAKKNKSENHYMKGKNYEEIYGYEKAKQLRAIRSKAAKGRRASEETKNKMRAHVFSEEHKKNISLSRKGFSLPLATRKKISAYFSDDTKNPKVDQTLYEFKHKVTGEIVLTRKIDMKKKYDCKDIHRITRDTNLSSKGWQFTGVSHAKISRDDS